MDVNRALDIVEAIVLTADPDDLELGMFIDPEEAGEAISVLSTFIRGAHEQ